MNALFWMGVFVQCLLIVVLIWAAVRYMHWGSKHRAAARRYNNLVQRPAARRLLADDRPPTAGNNEKE